MKNSRALAVGLLLASLAGCATSRTEGAPSQWPAPQASGETPERASWGELWLAEAGLVLPLPHAPDWKRDPSAATWSVFDHPATASRVLLRAWATREPATRARCESEARLARTLPLRDESAALETSHLDVPKGFDTQVEVRVTPAPDGGIDGFILAFGSRGRRCFSFVALTHASGDGAEANVGQRLGDFVQGSLAGLRERDDLLVPRERMR